MGKMGTTRWVLYINIGDVVPLAQKLCGGMRAKKVAWRCGKSSLSLTCQSTNNRHPSM
jgi:hypothetical protein